MRDDLRNAVRSLRKSPAFTTVALVVLALGIGAGTAIFSVVDAVVLRGLPFDEHDRIVAVLAVDIRRAQTFGGGSATTQTYLDWRRMQESFDGLAMVGGTSFRIKAENGEPADARAQRVTWEFFPALRVAPLLGRGVKAEDEVAGAPRVVVLSHGFWQRRFGGAPDAIGKTIELNEQPWEIVDVMPRGFAYPVESDAFVVVNQAAARKYWPGQGALGQRITMNKKERAVVGIVGDIRHLGPEMPARQEGYIPSAQDRSVPFTLVMRTKGEPLTVLPAVKAAIWSVRKDQRLTGDTFTLEAHMDRLIAQRRFNMALLALFGILGLVIAVVGLYGVIAYIVAQRTNEIGVRMALGATRGHVVSMVLKRAAILMGVGLVIGGAGAWYLSAGVKAFLFEVEPNDVRIFVAALATLTAAGLAASAVPARRAASVDPLVALRYE